MEKDLSCKGIKSSVKQQDWKLSQEGLVSLTMLLMLLSRTVEPQSTGADKNKADTGRHSAITEYSVIFCVAAIGAIPKWNREIWSRMLEKSSDLRVCCLKAEGMCVADILNGKK